MNIQRLKIGDAAIVDISPVTDGRGFFARSYCRQDFADANLAFDVVQTNISFSKQRGTLRGLHYQLEPKSEAKLVRCTRGKSWHVALDIRRESPSFGIWCAAELDPESHRAFFSPAGCAHGMITLADDTEINYLVGALYDPQLERGIRWNDPLFGINWPIEPAVISQRDLAHPNFDL